MTGITAHEDLTQRQSKTAQRMLRVYAMVLGLYHVQSSFSRKPKCHRLSVYWCLLIFDEYDAKSFNPNTVQYFHKSRLLLVLGYLTTTH
jgi:hypothetical protein